MEKNPFEPLRKIGTYKPKCEVKYTKLVKSNYKEIKDFINSHCDYYNLNDYCEECEYRDCKNKLVNDNFKIYKRGVKVGEQTICNRRCRNRCCYKIIYGR